MSTELDSAIRQAERRRVQRYPVRVPVTVVAYDDSIVGARGYTVDLSVCGVRVITDTDLRHGVDQTVMMDVPGDPLVIQAQLVRTEQRGERWVHGLFFGEVEEADQRRLGELCISG